ncbi:CobW/P47K family protein [Peptoniphilus duerdenii ATCC BAA-1640]|uniref:CobW/P47K family protein n=1 Tax=Peptoniphilus duerdenii ATCC BAA-1640 TaxID=862517 RepID=E0NKT2_9FIRM|nr:GTP-binding protein [Peptoniphilus duerdenii]EFM25597.1 CobW/P47K family protein [Peptoniphilus duerdenii ATCC BAA-1640]
MKKKLYVLTGFLGSGKTTFLLNLLDKIKDKKIGIIQNEFGKINVDGEIIDRDGIKMTEISRGSIFCSCLKLSFVESLAEMGKMDLDYVFVESSGLADPSNIEEILEAVKVLAGDVYEFKAAICLIDAVNFLDQIKEETVYRQLVHCHMAIVNKIDLVDENQIHKINEKIKEINPNCLIKYGKEGNIGLDFLSTDLKSLNKIASEDSLNTVDNKPKTISLQTEEILTRKELNEFLEKVLPDCYRIKGFFHLEEGWFQVDVVEKLIDYKPHGERKNSELVFLSKVGPKVIRTIDTNWKEIVNKPMKLKN